MESFTFLNFSSISINFLYFFQICELRFLTLNNYSYFTVLGHAVAQLVQVLWYKLDVAGSIPEELNFSIDLNLPAAQWP